MSCYDENRPSPPASGGSGLYGRRRAAMSMSEPPYAASISLFLISEGTCGHCT
ncbi:MAG: hypothetical protein ACK55I_12895 [bacterium]